MSQGGNIKRDERKARHFAVQKVVEKIMRETGEEPWQISVSRIAEGVAGDPSFAGCKSKNGRRNAIEGARKAIYDSRSKPTHSDDTRVAASHGAPPQEPPQKNLPVRRSAESKVDIVLTGLRELGVPEREVMSVLLKIAHALEAENTELRGLYAKEREENATAWVAVAQGREEREILVQKIKDNAAVFPSLTKEKNLVVFGE